MPKARKSGYLAKPGKFIGIEALNAALILKSLKASMYWLKADAPAEVPCMFK